MNEYELYYTILNSNYYNKTPLYSVIWFKLIIAVAHKKNATESLAFCDMCQEAQTSIQWVIPGYTYRIKFEFPTRFPGIKLNSVLFSSHYGIYLKAFSALFFPDKVSIHSHTVYLSNQLTGEFLEDSTTAKSSQESQVASNA